MKRTMLFAGAAVAMAVMLTGCCTMCGMDKKEACDKTACQCKESCAKAPESCCKAKAACDKAAAAKDAAVTDAAAAAKCATEKK